jgi:putative ABC transport system substrate-binding protein
VNIQAELTAKRLELLRALVPTAALIAMLFNPANPTVETQLGEAERAARTLGLQVLVLQARSEGELDAAFDAIVQRHAAALFVSGDPCSPAGARASSRWQRKTRFPQAIRFGISRWPAG